MPKSPDYHSIRQLGGPFFLPEGVTSEESKWRASLSLLPAVVRPPPLELSAEPHGREGLELPSLPSSNGEPPPWVSTELSGNVDFYLPLAAEAAPLTFCTGAG